MQEFQKQIQTTLINIHLSPMIFLFTPNIHQTGTDLGQIMTNFRNERERPKLLGGLGACSPGKTFWIFPVPFPGFWVIYTGYLLAGSILLTLQIGGLFNLSVSTRTAFLYWKCIILNIKNLTNFCKMVETGVDLCLSEGDKKFNAQNSQALNT